MTLGKVEATPCLPLQAAPCATFGEEGGGQKHESELGW